VSEKMILEKFKTGALVLSDGTPATASLRKTEITGKVTGPVATISISQNFLNGLNYLANIDYILPIPDNAFIIGFDVKLNTDAIHGEIAESEIPKEKFDQTLQEKHQAIILEEHRPNLVSIRIGNLRPMENIYTQVQYQQRLHFNDGVYQLVIPMGITPRYHSSAYPGERLNIPIASGVFPVGPVTLHLSVDTGIQAASPTCSSHTIKVIPQDEHRMDVLFENNEIPNHDLVLNIPIDINSPVLNSWCTQGSDGEYFLATLVPPPLHALEIQSPPKEFIFMLDRSGSMRGEPINQAQNALRSCLRSLNPDDTFNILVFDDYIDWFQPDPVPFTQKNIDQADIFLESIDGRGGTEIILALTSVLNRPEDKNRMRYIVFLTDGAVASEDEAYKQVREHLGNARLFTFGIGPSVNRALLKKLARLGKGFVEFLRLDQDIEGAILRFQDRVSFPVLTDLEVEWGHHKVWDVFPSKLPDLYTGETIEICGRLKRYGNKPVTFDISGLQSGKSIKLQASLISSSRSDPALSRIWANARIDELLDDISTSPNLFNQIRKEIINLGLEYQICTPYTSFIGISATQVQQNQQPVKVKVTQPLPKSFELSGSIQPVGSNYQRSMVSQVNSADLLDKGTEPMPAGSITPGSDEMAHYNLPADNKRDTITFQQRWLARTQMVNGSWWNSAEATSGALLTFLRSGHTTHKGIYRKQVKRSIDWLTHQSIPGFVEFLRALVFFELAQATGLAEYTRMADNYKYNLERGSSPVEWAVLDILYRRKIVSTPAEIRSMDDLRWSAVVKKPHTIPVDLLTGANSNIVQTWYAAMIAS
jgi:Ca-activated chloride channel family protein